MNSLFCDTMRLFRIVSLKLGTASPSRMPSTVIVNMSSSSVKPRWRALTTEYDFWYGRFFMGRILGARNAAGSAGLNSYRRLATGGFSARMDGRSRAVRAARNRNWSHFGFRR